MYDKICKVRRAKLQLSAEELASDQINHGIAMFKAYKYKIEQPDSPRIAPDQKLLLDSVCCIYVTRFVCCRCDNFVCRNLHSRSFWTANC